MAVTLRIDGREVKVSQGEVRLNRAAQSFTDLSFRGGDFTYTIQVVRDIDSEAVFRPATVEQAQATFARDTPYRAELVGAGQRFTGVFLLNEVTETTFAGNFVGDSVDWVRLLEGKNLQDIEADYRAGLTTIRTLGDMPVTAEALLEVNDDALAETAADSYIHSDGSAVVFPLLFYGAPYVPNRPTPGRTLDITTPADNAGYSSVALSDRPYFGYQDFTPAFYVTRVLRAIFEEIGWGVGGSFLADPQAKRLVLPYVGPDPWYKLVRRVVEFQFVGIGTIPTVLRNDHAIRVNSLTAGGVQGTHVIPLKYAGRITYEFTLSVTSGSGYTVGIYKGPPTLNAQTAEEFVLVDELTSAGTVTGETDIDVDQAIIVYLRPNGATITTTIELVTGEDDGIARLLPDMSQLDFVKGIVTLFNLAWYVPDGQRRINFVPRAEFFEPPSTDFDLDELVDAASVRRGPIGTAQVVRLSYTDDKDDAAAALVPPFGSGRFRIGGTTGPAEQVYEVPFAATAELEVNVTKNLTGTYSAPVFEEQQTIVVPFIARKEPLEGVQGDDLDEDIYYTPWDYDAVPRILKLAEPYTGLDLPARRFNTSTNTDEIVLVDVPRAIFLRDDSSWNDSTYLVQALGMTEPDGPYALHWTNYLNNLRNSVRVTLNVVLTPQQFARLRATQGCKFRGVSYEVVSVQGVSLGTPGVCTLTLIRR